jgi:hypothetical protein
VAGGEAGGGELRLVRTRRSAVKSEEEKTLEGALDPGKRQRPRKESVTSLGRPNRSKPGGGSGGSQWRNLSVWQFLGLGEKRERKRRTRGSYRCGRH